MIIAIDGTTSSGKGTLAKRIAKHYALPHLDTGLLYRAVAKLAMTKGIDTTNERECALLAEHVDLAEFDEQELRGAGVGAQASVVASLGAVRRALLDLQRKFANKKGGAVLDGRDIGTVIAPDADVKLWVDATVDERARRRYRELAARGEAVTPEGVLAQVKERDARDSSRKDAPMKPADDAVWVDTTYLDADGAYAKALEIVEQKRKEMKPKSAKAPVRPRAKAKPKA
jgi:CMP/dCMP kinase